MAHRAGHAKLTAHGMDPPPFAQVRDATLLVGYPDEFSNWNNKGEEAGKLEVKLWQWLKKSQAPLFVSFNILFEGSFLFLVIILGHWQKEQNWSRWLGSVAVKFEGWCLYEECRVHIILFSPVLIWIFSMMWNDTQCQDAAQQIVAFARALIKVLFLPCNVTLADFQASFSKKETIQLPLFQRSGNIFEHWGKPFMKTEKSILVLFWGTGICLSYLN